MAFAAACSTHPHGAVAAGEILGEVTEKLGSPPDLAVVFASGSRITDLPEVIEAADALLVPGTLLAVTACGTLAGAEEVENGDSLSLWAGDVGTTRSVRLETYPGNETLIAGLPDVIEDDSVLMICADPFTFDLNALLSRFENDYPTVAVVGGLASAGSSPGSNQLWLGSQRYTDGAIGVIFEPGIASPIVSQGCRPVGRPWTVTEVDRNRIRSLGGAPAMQRLRETIRNLSLDDTKLANDGLHIGFAGSDQIDQPVQGEFLVRAVLGGDPETGALAVGADVEIGQLVQFHIRDPASADSELGYLVTRATKGCDPSAALVFTCNGRGTNMFSEPHHDARLMSELVGGAVGGMFCAGEVGPVAGRNALHGLTATALLF